MIQVSVRVILQGLVRHGRRFVYAHYWIYAARRRLISSNVFVCYAPISGPKMGEYPFLARISGLTSGNSTPNPEI